MAGRRWSSTRRPSSPTTDPTPPGPSTRTSGSSTTWLRISPRSPTWPTRSRRIGGAQGPLVERGRAVPGPPLNNQPGRFGDPRYRRDRYEYLGQVGPLAEALAPNLKNRSFVIAAELVPPSGELPAGVIVAHGSHAGGYVLYLDEGRLHFTYNYVATQITTITAEVDPALEPLDREGGLRPHRRRGRPRALLRRRPGRSGSYPQDHSPDVRHPGIRRRLSAGWADRSRAWADGPSSRPPRSAGWSWRPPAGTRSATRSSSHGWTSPRSRDNCRGIDYPTAESASMGSSTTGRLRRS